MKNPGAQQSIEDQNLLTYCWPQIHVFENRGERSSSQLRGDMGSVREDVETLFTL